MLFVFFARWHPCEAVFVLGSLANVFVWRLVRLVCYLVCVCVCACFVCVCLLCLVNWLGLPCSFVCMFAVVMCFSSFCSDMGIVAWCEAGLHHYKSLASLTLRKCYFEDEGTVWSSGQFSSNNGNICLWRLLNWWMLLLPFTHVPAGWAPKFERESRHLHSILSCNPDHDSKMAILSIYLSIYLDIYIYCRICLQIYYFFIWLT